MSWGCVSSSRTDLLLPVCCITQYRPCVWTETKSRQEESCCLHFWSLLIISTPKDKVPQTLSVAGARFCISLYIFPVQAITFVKPKGKHCDWVTFQIPFIPISEMYWIPHIWYCSSYKKGLKSCSGPLHTPSSGSCQLTLTLGLYRQPSFLSCQQSLSAGPL